MNWILMPVRDNLALTKKAIQTFRVQDVGDIVILIFDNGSKDGTRQWLHTQHDFFSVHTTGIGFSVAESWNRGLHFVFDDRGEDHALVVNNDVELRPDTYRLLLGDGGLFVTAVGVQNRLALDPEFPIFPARKSPHPDFSCFLIRREAWDRVGPFDENFKVAFCEDWDYHVRLEKAGIRAESLDLPYLHHGSQTIKNATNEDRDRIQKQAEQNREYFYEKWGVRGGSPEYEALFRQGGTASPLPVEGTNDEPIRT